MFRFSCFRKIICCFIVSTTLAQAYADKITEHPPVDHLSYEELPLKFARHSESKVISVDKSYKKTYLLLDNDTPWFLKYENQKIKPNDSFILDFNSISCSPEWVGLFEMKVYHVESKNEIWLIGNPFGFNSFSHLWKVPQKSRFRVFEMGESGSGSGFPLIHVETGKSYWIGAGEIPYNQLSLVKGDRILLLDRNESGYSYLLYHAIKLPRESRPKSFYSTVDQFLLTDSYHGYRFKAEKFSIINNTLIPKVTNHPYFSPYSFKYYRKELPPWEYKLSITHLSSKDGKTHLIMTDGSHWFFKKGKYSAEYKGSYYFLISPLVPSLDNPGLFETNLLNMGNSQVIPVIGTREWP